MQQATKEACHQVIASLIAGFAISGISQGGLSLELLRPPDPAKRLC